MNCVDIKSVRCIGKTALLQPYAAYERCRVAGCHIAPAARTTGILAERSWLHARSFRCFIFVACWSCQSASTVKAQQCQLEVGVLNAFKAGLYASCVLTQITRHKVSLDILQLSQQVWMFLHQTTSSTTSGFNTKRLQQNGDKAKGTADQSQRMSCQFNIVDACVAAEPVCSDTVLEKTPHLFAKDPYHGQMFRYIKVPACMGQHA